MSEILMSVAMVAASIWLAIVILGVVFFLMCLGRTDASSEASSDQGSATGSPATNLHDGTVAHG